MENRELNTSQGQKRGSEWSRRYNSVPEADLLQAASKINTYLTPTDSTNQATVVSY